jgi:hypothetical protein
MRHALSVAEIVGLDTAMIDRELKLEIGFGIAQIDEREILEREPIRHVEVKGAPVERNGSLLVQHADHGVDSLGHGYLPSAQIGQTMLKPPFWTSDNTGMAHASTADRNRCKSKQPASVRRPAAQ